MKEIPGTDVFITPGNHDPFFAGFTVGTEAWPANVHLFGPDRRVLFGREEGSGRRIGFLRIHRRNAAFEGVERTVPEEYFRFLSGTGIDGPGFFLHTAVCGGGFSEGLKTMSHSAISQWS
jgi:hypothetical protein